MSAHYLLEAFKAPGIDGDRHGDPRLEQRINYDELLAQVAVDWSGLQLSAVVPNERAMQEVQAEEKVTVARELREDRPETKGIALLRSAIAPVQAEAAAEPEERYQEKEAAGWFREKCYNGTEGSLSTSCTCLYWAFRAHTVRTDASPPTPSLSAPFRTPTASRP